MFCSDVEDRKPISRLQAGPSLQPFWARLLFGNTLSPFVLSSFLDHARVLIFQVLFSNVYLFLRARDRAPEYEQGRGREREREAQNPKQAPGSDLAAQSPIRGSNLPA